MLGDFLTGCFVVVFAYAYPAFECYKTVEKNKVEIEQLRFWCQYWIIIALLTVFERFADIFISWLPMYGEIKLGFIIYLWYPNMKGTAHVYQTFVGPYIGKYEKDIDSILKIRTRALDLATLHLQNCVHYAQTAFFQILQYLAAQSANVRNMKSKNNSNGPTKQQQPDKTRTESVNRGVSPAPKTELVQERLSSEKLEQRVKCTTNTTEDNTINDNKKENSTNAKASDVANTPQSARATSNSKEESEFDVAEAIRAARGRLRRSPSNIPNNETKKEY